MFPRKRIHLAIVAALAATTGMGASAAIEEVVVTATKRSVSSQDVPIAIQAMSARQLEEQNFCARGGEH